MLPDDDPLETAEALIADGRAADAVGLLRSLLERGRGGLLTRTALVQALIAADELADATSVARETALTNPQAAIAANSLGEALLASGNLATAIGEFQRALRLDPEFTRARFLAGCAWLEAGEADKALEAFAAIGAEDGPPGLAGRIAEATAMRARPRSDPRYVRHLFDEFSSNYDERMLQQLAYGAPSILRELADMLGIVEPRSILDLGCGTGLAGMAFKDLATTLNGIDLSPAMIEKARARSIYDALHVADLESALADQDSHVDLIVAADTLVYLGNLEAVFAGVAQTLRREGHFLFTVEKSESAPFEFGPKRRWRHSEAYLRDLAARYGLEVVGLMACHPRSEAGVPVEGLAVALQKGLAEKVG